MLMLKTHKLPSKALMVAPTQPPLPSKPSPPSCTIVW